MQIAKWNLQERPNRNLRLLLCEPTIRKNLNQAPCRLKLKDLNEWWWRCWQPIDTSYRRARRWVLLFLSSYTCSLDWRQDNWHERYSLRGLLFSDWPLPLSMCLRAHCRPLWLLLIALTLTLLPRLAIVSIATSSIRSVTRAGEHCTLRLTHQGQWSWFRMNRVPPTAGPRV